MILVQDKFSRIGKQKKVEFQLFSKYKDIDFLLDLNKYRSSSILGMWYRTRIQKTRFILLGTHQLGVDI